VGGVVTRGLADRSYRSGSRCTSAADYFSGGRRSGRQMAEALSVDADNIVAIVLSGLAAWALFKTPRAERVGDAKARAAARGNRIFGNVIIVVMLLFGYGTCVAGMHMKASVYFSVVAIMVLLVAAWNNFK
jgi:nitrate reductase gamma subunit